MVLDARYKVCFPFMLCFILTSFGCVSAVICQTPSIVPRWGILQQMIHAGISRGEIRGKEGRKSFLGMLLNLVPGRDDGVIIEYKDGRLTQGRLSHTTWHSITGLRSSWLKLFAVRCSLFWEPVKLPIPMASSIGSADPAVVTEAGLHNPRPE